ncbi:MAG: hypothetical protein HKN42_09255 [Granulosicoccus sp.]|nr:hypothetical protein [Granulosicoccus sp.]
MRDISPEDRQRRLRLRVAAKLMLFMAVATAAYVLLSSISGRQDQASRLPTLRVPVGDLQPGQVNIVEWEGRPVIFYRRSAGDLATLRRDDARLLDPVSDSSEQPDFFDRIERSATPELFVAIALGTDLGCPVAYLPAADTAFQGKPWSGGFVDTCRQARYDLAGRVYRHQYADRNLLVPPYSVDEDTVTLGR